MITVNIIKLQNGRICGFVIDGHAEYDEKGSDIICAAVSTLAINTANSIEEFTNDIINVSIDEEEGGHLSLLLPEVSDDSELLLKAFVLGIKNIEAEYGNQYVTLVF
ncbi:MAG: ribosomal-processing cysteine protease Prp [Clostridiales bacterium]|nr:ribosomal-processing cysteine protease Prp [Clostridiales bacterium]